MSKYELAEAKRKLADLKVQAMMFDMDIDIETWSLVPKVKSEQPFWITRWREKEANSDFDTNMDIDRE